MYQISMDGHSRTEHLARLRKDKVNYEEFQGMEAVQEGKKFIQINLYKKI